MGDMLNNYIGEGLIWAWEWTKNLAYWAAATLSVGGYVIYMVSHDKRVLTFIAKTMVIYAMLEALGKRL